MSQLPIEFSQIMPTLPYDTEITGMMIRRRLPTVRFCLQPKEHGEDGHWNTQEGVQAWRRTHDLHSYIEPLLRNDLCIACGTHAGMGRLVVARPVRSILSREPVFLASGALALEFLSLPFGPDWGAPNSKGVLPDEARPAVMEVVDIREVDFWDFAWRDNHLGLRECYRRCIVSCLNPTQLHHQGDPNDQTRQCDSGDTADELAEYYSDIDTSQSDGSERREAPEYMRRNVLQWLEVLQVPWWEELDPLEEFAKPRGCDEQMKMRVHWAACGRGAGGPALL